MFILLVTSAGGLSVMAVCLSTCRPLPLVPPSPQQAAVIAVPEQGAWRSLLCIWTVRTVTKVLIPNASFKKTEYHRNVKSPICLFKSDTTSSFTSSTILTVFLRVPQSYWLAHFSFWLKKCCASRLLNLFWESTDRPLNIYLHVVSAVSGNRQ